MTMCDIQGHPSEHLQQRIYHACYGWHQASATFQKNFKFAGSLSPRPSIVPGMRHPHVAPSIGQSLITQPSCQANKGNTRHVASWRKARDEYVPYSSEFSPRMRGSPPPPITFRPGTVDSSMSSWGVGFLGNTKCSPPAFQFTPGVSISRAFSPGGTYFCRVFELTFCGIESTANKSITHKTARRG